MQRHSPNDHYYYSKRGLIVKPFQLPMSYKRGKENKRKIGQERSSMQQAEYQVIGPVHECKKVCPCTKTLRHSSIRA